MEQKQAAVQVIRGMMSELESDVNTRNAYMNLRYGMVYENGIMSGLKIKAGHDVTRYNYLPRVCDIHAAQLFGRVPQLVSTYDKEDLSIYQIGVTDQKQADVEMEKAKLRNSRTMTDAEVRNQAARNIWLDNDFEETLARGAGIGTWAGVTVIKGWLDKKAEMYKFSLLETPQNFARYWSHSNFRDSDADFYTYQISTDKAIREYSKFLTDGESFTQASATGTWWKATAATNLENKTIPKVWVVDATGFFRGFNTDGNGNIKVCKPGEETKFNILIVGDVVVQVNDASIPKYWVVNHEDAPGQPWGRSAISDELISVNQTMIETMSDWRTASWKVTFPKLKGIGFDDMNVPYFDERASQFLPLGEGQDILPLTLDHSSIQEFPRLMAELWSSFTKFAKVSRVMLDDPTINPASNQGLMTSMKALIDSTEDRQKRWTTALIDMMETALNESTAIKGEAGLALKEAVQDNNWRFTVKWPSVFRSDDPSYQQMVMNQWNAGLMSPESAIEAFGRNASEEIDRIRDVMTDPLRAGIMTKTLTQIAGSVIGKSLPSDPTAGLQTKVQLRGELSPAQVGNLGATYNLDKGVYGDGVGPQGFEGTVLNSDTINQGMVNNDAVNTSSANYMSPAEMNPQPANPTLTPAQNTGDGNMSMPGSGATGVSPQGAINQVNQQAGR